MICPKMKIQNLIKEFILPPLFHKEMQPDIAHRSEKDEKHAKQRNIRPPK